jgi:hypothetical protein
LRLENEAVAFGRCGAQVIFVMDSNYRDACGNDPSACCDCIHENIIHTKKLGKPVTIDIAIFAKHSTEKGRVIYAFIINDGLAVHLRIASRNNRIQVLARSQN